MFTAGAWGPKLTAGARPCRWRLSASPRRGAPGAAWAPFISDVARKGSVVFPRLRIPLGKPTSHPISSRFKAGDGLRGEASDRVEGLRTRAAREINRDKHLVLQRPLFSSPSHIHFTRPFFTTSKTFILFLTSSSSLCEAGTFIFTNNQHFSHTLPTVFSTLNPSNLQDDFLHLQARPRRRLRRPGPRPRHRHRLRHRRQVQRRLPPRLLLHGAERPDSP